MRIRDKNYLLCNIYGDPTSDQEAHNTLTKLNHKMEEIKTQYPIDHYILGEIQPPAPENQGLKDN